VLTPDELEGLSLPAWASMMGIALQNTRLVPGDVVAAAGVEQEPVGAGAVVELTWPPFPFGVLRNTVAR